jgi:hypothetical protein
MRKEPVKISLIKKENEDTFSIRFPNLKIPVIVNGELYQKMLHSNQYEFVDNNKSVVKRYSA